MAEKSSNSHRVYEQFSLFTAIGVYVLILLGGYVKAIHAGLACPDWPLCHGQIFPVDQIDNPGVWAEYIHRLVAAVMAICMVILFFMARKLSAEVNELKNVTLGFVILVIIQSVMGGLTVLYTLHPLIVTGHLGLGTLTFMVTIYNYWVIRLHNKSTGA